MIAALYYIQTKCVWPRKEDFDFYMKLANLRKEFNLLELFTTTGTITDWFLNTWLYSWEQKVLSLKNTILSYT